LFQLLQPIAFKIGLEYSISYNLSHRPGENKRENALSTTIHTICLQQHKFLMTLKHCCKRYEGEELIFFNGNAKKNFSNSKKLYCS